MQVAKRPTESSSLVWIKDNGDYTYTVTYVALVGGKKALEAALMQSKLSSECLLMLLLVPFRRTFVLYLMSGL